MWYGPTSSSNGTQLFADVYIIGAQSVTGNWTTGYTVAYTGRQVLNVTVQWTTPSTYNVTGVMITNLTNQTSQGSFDAVQKQAVGIALANSMVKSGISGMDCFVSFVDPQINDLCSGYWVLINQINGCRGLAVLINSGLIEVSEVVVSTSYPNFGAP
jgi:hypothetical protein